MRQRVQNIQDIFCVSSFSCNSSSPDEEYGKILPQYSTAFTGLHHFVHLRAPRGSWQMTLFRSFCTSLLSKTAFAMTILANDRLVWSWIIYSLERDIGMVKVYPKCVLKAENVDWVATLTQNTPCSWTFSTSCFFHAATSGIKDALHNPYISTFLWEIILSWKRIAMKCVRIRWSGVINVSKELTEYTIRAI